VADNKLQAWFAGRTRRNEQWERAVAEQHLEGVRQRGGFSDEELIAKAPGFPGPGYQMEMERRLKDAITELTTQTVAARKSADRTANRLVWLTIVLVVLTAALVALTVVLAVRR
jgi:hypothetical protein